MSKKSRKNKKSVEAAHPEPRVETAPAAEAASVPARNGVIAGIVFAVLLVIILGLRITIDGIVYPYWNFPFLAAVGILFAVWAVLALLRVCPVHLPRETALLAGFVLWAAIGLTYTVQYDATFRAVLLWTSYACAFVLAASALNSRAAVTIMLGGFMLTAFAEGVWSMVHAQYILPLVRMQVQTDPALLDQYFGVRAATDELGHRLQSNRAFGTFLFPNALGAYAALAIPLAVAGAVVSWRRVRERQADHSFHRWARESESRNRGWMMAASLAMAIFTALVLFSCAFILIGLIGQTDVLGRSWFSSAPVFWFSVAVMPLVCAGAVLYAMRVYGFEGFFTLFRAVAYPLAAMVLIATLYAAFSRGAIIALMLTAVIMAWLTLRPPRWIQANGRALAALALAGFALAAITAGVVPSTATAQDAPVALEQPLDVVGTSPTMAEALSGQTFGLRLGYWQVGLHIWLDNFLGGVGLGNFGTVYARYQFIGASDVKTAHNDFLQILVETGPIGFLLFTGFWGVFFFHGARALPTITDRHQRLMALGLYAGLLAFVLHSAVDFNFVNPSLTLPALALAGTFHAMVRPYRVTPAPSSRQTVQLALLIPALALVAVLAGAGTRAYYTDTQLRRLGHATQFNNLPLQMANYILAEAVPEKVNPQADFNLPVAEAMALIPDRPALESMGMIVAPTGNPNNPWRRVSANEPLGGQMRVIIRNFDEAHRAARHAAERRVEALAGVDTGYPHRPEVAAHMYQWYYLLLNTTQDKSERAAFTAECVKWAREAVARSPYQSWYHSFLANALWEKGKQATGNERLQALEEALVHYQRAAELMPMQTALAHEYAYAMKAYGEALLDMGRELRGQLFVSRADAEHHRAVQLQERINAWRYGQPAAGENAS